MSAYEGDPEPYRSAPEDRWTGGDVRTVPGEIEVRTRFLYSEPSRDAVLPEGRTRWAFGRGGQVTSSDWPSPYEHMQDIASHVSRAVASFGDDADLVIEVRLADNDEVVSTVHRDPGQETR